MGTTYRFLALQDEAEVVLDWFRDLQEPMAESVHEQGVLFYFRNFGPLTEDVKSSPLVNIFLPVQKRGVLTTAGEVHFLSTPMKQFPGLNKVNRQFRKWIRQYELVFSHSPSFNGQYSYYLEGSLRNWDPDLYALPLSLDALNNGNYFVSMEDNDYNLDKLCKQLKLRGVEGIE